MIQTIPRSGGHPKMADKSVHQNVEIDVEALKRKYAEEREKRLRSEGTSQYRELSGEFAFLDKDPWAGPLSREPVVETVDVLIIGGGMSGLLAGAHLRQRGVKSLRIVDKSGDFGGTW